MSSENSISKLIAKYDSSSVKRATRLKFESIGMFDVYNITAPFKVRRSMYILGRVEMRDNELGAKVMFFKKKGRTWVFDPYAPIFNMQDPFITKIGDLFVVGGVEVMQKSLGGKIRYRTVFYKGSDIYSLRQFATGPWGMKDIRLVGLDGGKVGIFTRPQGRKGGKGKIGFTIVNSLSGVKARKISNAEILKDQFDKGEWGGVNETHLLDNGLIGVLGHIAKFKEDNGEKFRYYYPITFIFNPETMKFSDMKIIATRKKIPKSHAKRPDLYNVIFPGGLIREGYKSKLYVGVADAEAFKLILDDPFKEIEKE